jgi:hypothetical protein
VTISKENLTCIACRYFYFDRAEPQCEYGTCGSDVGIGCHKYVWEIDNFEDSDESYREKLRTAQACELFEPYEPGVKE